MVISNEDVVQAVKYAAKIGYRHIETTEAPLPAFLEFNTSTALQATPDRAAVACDFTMLENEVEPVLIR